MPDAPTLPPTDSTELLIEPARREARRTGWQAYQAPRQCRRARLDHDGCHRARAAQQRAFVDR